MYLSFYCKGSKRVTQGFTVRGSWRLNKDCNILTPTLYGRQRCVFLVLQGSTGGPGAHSAGSGLFLPHLVTNRSPNSIKGPEGPFGRLWLSLPHLVSNSVFFLSSQSYIIVQSPTQSPTQSLEWHVWSSSGGNNSHAVQRSLSSGASVYECIMGFNLVPFRQASVYAISFDYWPLECVTSFRCITLEMACLAGSKVNI